MAVKGGAQLAQVTQREGLRKIVDTKLGTWEC